MSNQNPLLFVIQYYTISRLLLGFMAFWTLVRLYSSHLSKGIFMMLVGMTARRNEMITGPLVFNLAYLLFYLVIPLTNINLFLKASISEFFSVAVFLVPLWIFKALLSYLFCFVVSSFATLPPYFEKTFIAMLMSDSIASHMNFHSEELCEIVSPANESGVSPFNLKLPCDPYSQKLTFYISLMNGLTVYGIAPYFLKSDYLFYKTYGKSMMWIEHELYFTKFENDIEKDRENYDLLIGNRRIIGEQN